MLPWGIPLNTSRHEENLSLTLTLNSLLSIFLSAKKLFRQPETTATVAECRRYDYGHRNNSHSTIYPATGKLMAANTHYDKYCNLTASK